MAVVNLKCPHCLRLAQLKVIGYSLWPQVAGREEKRASLGAICPGCQNPVSILAERQLPFDATSNNRFSNAMQSLLNSTTPLETSYLKPVDSWPKPAEPAIPDHVPEPVAKAFLQAERNYVTEGHEEAAAMMYRRSLELALNQKYPDISGNLSQIIKALVERNVLTADLGTWANDVRLLGNEAAHAEGVTREELVMMRGFADAVLRYVWTLPTQVAQRRATMS